jgi:flagellar hook-associated protein 2
MGRISTGIGLISGINSKDVIDQLMALESRPRSLLQTRIDQTNQRKLAYTDLRTRLTTLRLSATTLKKTSTFQNATATSTDENVLTATTSAGCATGQYRFQVARLVTTQQAVSGGFADPDSVKVGAGTLTLEQGGGELFSPTPLSQLNGGQGVRRGAFRITDRAGNDAVIDISSAVTLEDVVRRINTALSVTVRASLGDEGLVLTDLTGKTTSNFIVQDLADGHAAEDLGIVANAASATITGSDINRIGDATSLAQLNDGRGVRRAASGNDLSITTGGGSWNVSLAGLTTLGQAIDAINAATGGVVTASVASGGNGIQLADSAHGAITVAALNGSKAAADLGIEGTGNDVLTGEALIATLGTVLISSVRGGTGLNLGTINITDKSGTSATVDLSGAQTVQDILDAINAAAVSVTASLKASGNGIQLQDTSGGSGNLIITEGNSTTAAELGLIANTSEDSVQGANLQRQWVSEATLLSGYNGGKGVSLGKFKITNSRGVSTTIDLSGGTITTLGDLISTINARGIGVTASINANGDGLLLTDSAAGALKLTVDEVEGRAAADLNIKGTATATTIDGSFEKTLVLDANDTLATAQTKINELGFGLSASIINDGTGLSPYRLSLTARNSGRNGRVVFDAGATGLGARNLVEAQDAAVFLGGTDSAQPLLITASRNQLSGVVRGVTIELQGTSDEPVTLNVTPSADNVSTELTKFADTFNQLTARLTELTKFDTDTNERGLLLGESTAQEIETQVFATLQTVVAANSKYRILADVGLRLGADAQLEFDAEKFAAAYADDPAEVQRLFTTTTTGAASVMETRINRLIDPVNGVITRENNTLDDRTKQFQDRIESLDKILEQKRARLEKQFANLESVLAKLQSQQASLTQLSNLAYLSTNNK